MLEKFFGLFYGSSGRNSNLKRENDSVVYITKTTLSGGRKGYLVRGLAREEAFYDSIQDAAKAVAGIYAKRHNICLSTLRGSFKISSISQKELDAIVLECEMHAGGKPKISSELKMQASSCSEPKISVKNIRTSGRGK